MKASANEGRGASTPKTEEKEKGIRLVTELPGPKTKAEVERAKKNNAQVVYQMFPDWEDESGSGSILYDADGNHFIDMLTGVGVNHLGVCHPRIVDAGTAQLKRLIHGNDHVAHIPAYSDITEAVRSVAPEGLRNGKGFWGNSGGEAVEAALKAARQSSGKPIVIGFRPAFHGRPMGALHFTSGPAGRINLAGLMVGAKMADYPYEYHGVTAEMSLESVEKILKYEVRKEEVAAIIFEPIAGEPGVIPGALHPTWLRDLRKFADDNGLLLIADEVQNGLGRTGKWFGVDHSGVSPDIMTLGKAVGGGLPLGGVLINDKVDSRWPKGSHASTFGGNPVACAMGVETINVIKEEGLVERAASEGAYIQSRFRELADRYPIIGDVRGAGMLIAMELVKDQDPKKPAKDEAGKIKMAAWRRGVITSVTGSDSNVIRIAPALNIPREYVDEAIDVIDQSFKEVLA